MISRIKQDAKTIPKTIGYRLDNNLATLSDEEEACKNPKWAYMFAHDIHGADIEKCQEVACKNPIW
ncbi:MAG: hypothetical protein WC942_07355, partial [Clostridia bacterium]